MRIQRAINWWWVYHFFLLVFPGLNEMQSEIRKWELVQQKKLQEMPQVLSWMRMWLPMFQIEYKNSPSTFSSNFSLFSCILAPKQSLEAKAIVTMTATRSLKLWERRTILHNQIIYDPKGWERPAVLLVSICPSSACPWHKCSCIKGAVIWGN